MDGKLLAKMRDLKFLISHFLYTDSHSTQ